jgi:hypothetical protein
MLTLTQNITKNEVFENNVKIDSRIFVFMTMWKGNQ